MQNCRGSRCAATVHRSRMETTGSRRHGRLAQVRGSRWVPQDRRDARLVLSDLGHSSFPCQNEAGNYCFGSENPFIGDIVGEPDVARQTTRPQLRWNIKSTRWLPMARTPPAGRALLPILRQICAPRGHHYQWRSFVGSKRRCRTANMSRDSSVR
jgi:hypothetical protein